MGFIERLIAKRNEKEAKMKALEEEDSIFRNIETKKKSHYEREAIKLLEEEKQKSLREALMWEGKKRNAEDKLKARKMMGFNSELFNNENILKEKRNFLRGGLF